MKQLSLIALLFISANNWAQANQPAKQVTLPVDVSYAKVKWTTLGYSSFLVKFRVPEIANHTLLNQRNDGEDGPCLFTSEGVINE